MVMNVWEGSAGSADPHPLPLKLWRGGKDGAGSPFPKRDGHPAASADDNEPPITVATLPGVKNNFSASSQSEKSFGCHFSD